MYRKTNMELSSLKKNFFNKNSDILFVCVCVSEKKDGKFLET